MRSAGEGEGHLSFPEVWVEFDLLVPDPDCISACRSVPQKVRVSVQFKIAQFNNQDSAIQDSNSGCF